MEATVTWKQGLQFSGVASGTNFPISIGTHRDDGPSDGASPMELILMATAGCTAMDVISILLKKRQHVTQFEVRIHGDRASDHPKVFTHMTMEYVVTGRHLDPEAVARAVELSLDKYCSVHAMISKSVPMEHKYTVIEAEDTAKG